MPILDFKELSTSRASAQPGEDLEGLIRQIDKRLGLNPEWSGRGADQGRDLIFTERRKGALGTQEVRWLVICKDFAHSSRSVTEQDAPSVTDKVAQHNAAGFLLATTTTVSTGLKAVLDGLKAKGQIDTAVWDRHELEALLLQEDNSDLLKRYLPLSYSAARRLNTLPQALESLEKLVPSTIYSKITKVIETYRTEDAWLTGDMIWPHDRTSAKVIDFAVGALLEREDPHAASAALLSGEIEFDAFEAVLSTLASVEPTSAQELCRELVRAGNANGSSLYAFRFYADNFEPNNEEQIQLAKHLAQEDLYDLYSDEVASFIGEELISNPQAYRFWSDVDELSSHSTVEEGYAYDLEFSAKLNDNKIDFHSKLHVFISLSYGKGDYESSSTFPGVAKGYIDAYGIHIEDVDVDTMSFYM